MLKLKPQDRIEIRCGNRLPSYNVIAVDGNNVVLEANGIYRTASYEALQRLYEIRKHDGLIKLYKTAQAEEPALALVT